MDKISIMTTAELTTSLQEEGARPYYPVGDEFLPNIWLTEQDVIGTLHTAVAPYAVLVARKTGQNTWAVTRFAKEAPVETTPEQFLVVEVAWDDEKITPLAYTDEGNFAEWRERERKDAVDVYAIKAIPL